MRVKAGLEWQAGLACVHSATSSGSAASSSSEKSGLSRAVRRTSREFCAPGCFSPSSVLKHLHSSRVK